MNECTQMEKSKIFEAAAAIAAAFIKTCETDH